MPVTEQDLIEIRNGLHAIRTRITNLETKLVQMDSTDMELQDEIANIKMTIRNM